VLVSDDGTTQTHNLLGLSLIHQDNGSQTRTLLADGLGSVRVEMVGSAIDSATTYEPYGKLLARSGHSGTVYGYTGEQHDAATGLVYLRARYYNPNLKLFLTRDPFPGWQTVPASQHGYSYVHNNPVNLTDPSGEFVPLIPLIVGGFVIAAVTGVTWDVMVNQGKGGLDNLHNILNPHHYCDVNWGQAAFTGAVGGIIGTVVAGGAAVVTRALRPTQVPFPDIPSPPGFTEPDEPFDVPLETNWQFPDSRKENQAERRGWGTGEIQEVLDNPVQTRDNVNKATGNSATYYYREDGHYIVRDDVTGDIFHVSDTSKQGWIDPNTNQPIKPMGGP
jgi:RHS repeat-associated protein